MEIIASINNYDIVTEIGEANIKETVKNEFKKWAKSISEEEFKQYCNKDLTDSQNLENKKQLSVFTIFKTPVIR